jgi:ArsR family transcriptional regulator
LEQPTSSLRADPAIVRAAQVALLDARAAAVLATACRALCDPTRAQIMRALGAGTLTVTDLTGVIGRRRTVTSQHLRVLREAGLIQARRQGRALYYQLTAEPAVIVAQAALMAAADTARG